MNNCTGLPANVLIKYSIDIRRSHTLRLWVGIRSLGILIETELTPSRRICFCKGLKS